MFTRSITLVHQPLAKLGVLCGVITVLCCSAIIVSAQSVTAPQRGFFPTGSYATTGLETINPTNGNLMLNIPLPSLPAGRGGHKSGIGLIYNSKLWDSESGPGFDTSGNPISVNGLKQSMWGGWKYGYNFDLHLDEDSTGPCDGSSHFEYKLTVVFPDGGQHIMLPSGYPESYGYSTIRPDGKIIDLGCNVSYTTNMVSYFSTDGSFLRLDVQHDVDTNWKNNPWTLYFPDGTRVTGGNAPQRIYDRNNNYVEILNFTVNNQPVIQIRDQLGRYLSINIDNSLNQDYVYAIGHGGRANAL